MKRWLALVVLLGWCSGCELFDDAPSSWMTQEPPTASSCNRPPCGESVQQIQTTEPELLKTK